MLVISTYPVDPKPISEMARAAALGAAEVVVSASEVVVASLVVVASEVVVASGVVVAAVVAVPDVVVVSSPLLEPQAAAKREKAATTRMRLAERRDMETPRAFDGVRQR
jgi:hypothetical protein